MKLLAVLVGACVSASAHDVITTPLTWTREISRIVYARCASCHYPGGSSFSLIAYSDVRPWAEAIKEEVLTRRMPPWGAVKGFGDFLDDQALTAEQIEMVERWANGGAPEGEPAELPSKPENAYQTGISGGAVAVSGEFKLAQTITLTGLYPSILPSAASFQITVEFSDGQIIPLLWLDNYRTQFRHVFLLRTPLELPPGVLIHGVPANTVLLVPAASAPSQSRSWP